MVLGNPRFDVHLLRVDEKRAWGFTPGDVVVLTKRQRNGYAFLRPGVVMEKEVRVPNEGWFIWLREDTRARGKAWPTVKAHLSQRGLKIDPELSETSDRSEIEAVLSLWGLESPTASP